VILDIGSTIVEAMSGDVTLSNGLEMRAIGERVRAERLSRALSLDDVAELSGVSRSMVSEIERGRKVPTIVVLDRITAALGTSLVRLVQPEESTHVVVRRADEQQVVEDPAGWRRRILSPVLPNVEFEFMKTTIGPGVDAGTWLPHGAGSREYVAIESGTLVLTIDGDEYELRAGDSIYHDGNCTHSYRNPGKKDCNYYLVLDLGDVGGAPRRHR
jgi:transcriptional regulator with XRE-family HTH domain